MASESRLKTNVSTALIAIIVAAVYALSPILFFLVEQDSSTVFTYFTYATPILVGALVVLLLLMPNRRLSREKIQPIREKRITSTKRGLIGIGAISGLIAGVSISLLILLVEFLMQLPSGLYFSVLGANIGIVTMGTTEYSFHFGLLAHLATGSFVGAIFGGIMMILPICDVRKQGQTIVFGLMAGFMAFIVLFNPLSRFGIEPALVEILTGVMSDYSSIVIENTLNDIMTTLLAGSIILHMIYGFILGLSLHKLSRKCQA